MTTPGCAPPTPASHDPFVEETSPLAYSAVSSPKYQMFPNRSWAYQSNVSSARSPFAEKTWSCTTVVVTPRITFVRSVTDTTLRSRSPSDTPSNTVLVPGMNGMYGLSITATKSSAGGRSGRYVWPFRTGAGFATASADGLGTGEGLEATGRGDGDVGFEGACVPPHAPATSAKPAKTIVVRVRRAFIGSVLSRHRSQGAARPMRAA